MNVDVLSKAGSSVTALLASCDTTLSDYDIESVVESLLRAYRLNVEGSYIDPSARISRHSLVQNSLIMAGAEVYEFVTIRNCILLPGSRVGHGGEIARSIIGSQASLPRFNYVGATIIGDRVRFGGCVSVATRRYDDLDVIVHGSSTPEPTHRHKFGGVIGEDALIGYGTHINPGVIVGRRCIVGPMVDLRVSIPDDKIVILEQQLRMRDRPEVFSHV